MYVVLDTTPPSVQNSAAVPPSVRNSATLSADAAPGYWPPTKVSAPTQPCRHRPCAITEYLSSLMCYVLSSLSSSRIIASIQAFLLYAFPVESGTAESPWQLSSPRQGTPLHIAYRSKQHCHRTGRFTFRSQCGRCPPPAANPASETAPKLITVKASQFTGSLSVKV
jgi:hypothetical protein